LPSIGEVAVGKITPAPAVRCPHANWVVPKHTKAKKKEITYRGDAGRLSRSFKIADIKQEEACSNETADSSADDAIPCRRQAGDLTIATFNAEFLTRAKIHAKFGVPLELKDLADIAFWGQASNRDQKIAEGARAVARVVANINADLIVLTEVGDRRDVDEAFPVTRAMAYTSAR
jgi:hypothetical protein